MTTKVPTGRPQQDRRHRRPQPPGTGTSYVAVIAAAIVAILAIVLILFLNDRANDSDGNSSEPATTAEPSVTSEPQSSEPPQPTASAGSATTAIDPAAGSTTAPQVSTSTTEAPVATSTGGTTTPTAPAGAVIWPDPKSGVQFATPEAAAMTLAEDVLGFGNPVLGEFRSGDARSGEIELRSTSGGSVSTILLRQTGSDDSWSVLAVVNENIVIDDPAAGGILANPMALIGKARAFEGHVDVRLYAHGQSEPVATGFVTGRGDGVLGPFSDTLDWPATTSGTGILVLSTSSAEDGSLWEAAAIPVRFP